VGVAAHGGAVGERARRAGGGPVGIVTLKLANDDAEMGSFSRAGDDGGGAVAG